MRSLTKAPLPLVATGASAGAERMRAVASTTKTPAKTTTKTV
jgi:hypothetical protein